MKNTGHLKMDTNLLDYLECVTLFEFLVSCEVFYENRCVTQVCTE